MGDENAVEIPGITIAVGAVLRPRSRALFLVSLVAIGFFWFTRQTLSYSFLRSNILARLIRAPRLLRLGATAPSDPPTHTPLQSIGRVT